MIGIITTWINQESRNGYWENCINTGAKATDLNFVEHQKKRGNTISKNLPIKICQSKNLKRAVPDKITKNNSFKTILLVLLQHLKII